MTLFQSLYADSSRIFLALPLDLSVCFTLFGFCLFVLAFCFFCWGFCGRLDLRRGVYCWVVFWFVCGFGVLFFCLEGLLSHNSVFYYRHIYLHSFPTVLGLAGTHLIFVVASHTITCHRFIVKPVLITEHCYSSY